MKLPSMKSIVFILLISLLLLLPVMSGCGSTQEGSNTQSTLSALSGMVSNTYDDPIILEYYQRVNQAWVDSGPDITDLFIKAAKCIQGVVAPVEGPKGVLDCTNAFYSTLTTSISLGQEWGGVTNLYNEVKHLQQQNGLPVLHLDKTIYPGITDDYRVFYSWNDVNEPAARAALDLVLGKVPSDQLNAAPFGEFARLTSRFYEGQMQTVIVNVNPMFLDTVPDFPTTTPTPIPTTSPSITWSVMPSPTNEPLCWMWGLSSSDIFCVGWSGTILHYNGTTWSTMNSGTSRLLRGVWGTSSYDVFAVGWEGTIVHYDGNTWKKMTSGTANNLGGVWGSSSSNVFAVGDNGTILHYDGHEWKSMTSVTTTHLTSVWGSSESNVFAVGLEGTIIRYNGYTWSRMNSGTTMVFRGVWGASSSDIFAVGDGGTTVMHYDGSSWSSMNIGTYVEHLFQVWGSDSRDVFTVGTGGKILHYDGSAWSSMPNSNTNGLEAVWGSSSYNVFAGGNGGTILNY